MKLTTSKLRRVVTFGLMFTTNYSTKIAWQRIATKSLKIVTCGLLLSSMPLVSSREYVWRGEMDQLIKYDRRNWLSDVWSLDRHPNSQQISSVRRFIRDSITAGPFRISRRSWFWYRGVRGYYFVCIVTNSSKKSSSKTALGDNRDDPQRHHNHIIEWTALLPKLDYTGE